MLSPARPTLRACARATRGGALITGLLLALLPEWPFGGGSSPPLVVALPLTVLGLWVGFTVAAYGLLRLVAAERVRGRRRCGGLPLRVISTFPDHHGVVGLAVDQPSLRLPARVTEVRLRRADVPGVASAWAVEALPPYSVRGQVGRALAEQLRVGPDEAAATLGPGRPTEAALEAAAAELVLLARCFAEDDAPALAELTAEHPPEVAATFAERLLTWAPDHSAAGALARRYADSHTPRLRALARLRLARVAPDAVARLRALRDEPLPPGLAERVWQALAAHQMAHTDWSGLVADLERAPPAAVAETTEALLDQDHSGSTRALVRCWRAPLPQALRRRLQAALAARTALDGALEAGLEVADALALELAFGHHAARHGPAALAARCAALLGALGAIAHPDDPRPPRWLEQIGAGGGPTHLPLLRRWAAAVDPAGRPAADARLAAEVAILRLAAALPEAGALALVDDQAAGGLSLADPEGARPPAAPRPRR